MKLREACELGRDMGCSAIEEAVLNVEIHAPSLFDWDKISDEILEMRTEYYNLPPWMVNIKDLLER